jgi:hypothetical protein
LLIKVPYIHISNLKFVESRKPALSFKILIFPPSLPHLRLCYPAGRTTPPPPPPTRYAPVRYRGCRFVDSENTSSPSLHLFLREILILSNPRSSETHPVHKMRPHCMILCGHILCMRYSLHLLKNTSLTAIILIVSWHIQNWSRIAYRCWCGLGLSGL